MGARAANGVGGARNNNGALQFGRPKGEEENQVGLHRSQTEGVSNRMNLRQRTNKKQRINIMPSKYQDGLEFGDIAGGGGENDYNTQSMQTMDPQQANRTNAIQQIESALRDVSSLFQKFGTIVAQHEKLVERIDENAEQALYDIEGAKKEIREIYENTSNNRTLIMKVFFILLIFCTFYILFVL